MSDFIDKNNVLQNDARWRNGMPTVTVSTKYQVVIPKDIREEMDIKPGQKVQMSIYKGNILLVPLRPIEQLRGILKGIDITVERDI
jgi:AbrB family looped-hinge helix DNA binding protein